MQIISCCISLFIILGDLIESRHRPLYGTRLIPHLLYLLGIVLLEYRLSQLGRTDVFISCRFAILFQGGRVFVHYRGYPLHVLVVHVARTRLALNCYLYLPFKLHVGFHFGVD
jgi:hypothetical protein